MKQAEEQSPLLTVCCECGKVRLGRRWLDARLGPDYAGTITHAFCPHCYRKAMLTAALSRGVSLRSARV
jgi:hypothetical protein